ncbi:MAG: Crp/Fnr family transcriptional regulator [Crocinitomicaceae bacterium]
MKEELKNYIRKCLDLSETELEEVVSYYKTEKVPRKTVLLRAGEICNLEAFIIKGCVKSYFINQEGLEVVLSFATENWWVGDVVSFQELIPSKMYIETMEDTEMLFITHDAKEELLQKHPALEKMFRLIIQRHLYAYQERLFGNIALTAEERYDIFLSKYPALPQRIPQHLIASYLGMTPEFLSRLRKRKLGKNR